MQHEETSENSLSSLTSAQIYWKLFSITLTMSACTFGGGFVIISMMQQKFVDKLHWLEQEEMLDMTAIAQASPGALGVNIAIVTGYRLKKAGGAIVCTFGAVIPPLVIISVISVFYNQFKDNAWIAIALQVMRSGVAAVICSVVIDLVQNILKTKNILWIAMIPAAFAAVCFFQVNAIVIILVCGLIGLVHELLTGREGKA